MKQNLFNRKRANLIEKLLARCARFETGPGIDAGITDALSHLRHLCDKYDLDYNELNDRGAWHYDNEVFPDDIELGLRAYWREEWRKARVARRESRQATVE